jgi:hypothetical protein
VNSEKLPIENYKYDVSYLDKKYNDIDHKRKSKEFHQPQKSYLKHWYHSSQELIINHLEYKILSSSRKKGDLGICNSLARPPYA